MLVYRGLKHTCKIKLYCKIYSFFCCCFFFLYQAENEKSKISNCLQETQQQLEQTKGELNDQNSKVQRMVEHISALIALYGKHGEIEDGNSVEDPERVRLMFFFLFT